jgi:hypothetical protein
MATAAGKVTAAKVAEGMRIMVTHRAAKVIDSREYAAYWDASQTKVKDAEALTVTAVALAKVHKVMGRQITGTTDSGATVEMIVGAAQTFWLAPDKPAAKPVPEKSASQKAKATRQANQRAAKPETRAQTIKRSRARNSDIREREAAQDAKRAAKATEPPRSSVSPGTPAKGEKIIGAKAERLADAARALGWQTAVSIVGNLGAMMVAARGQETVTLTWDDEVVKVKGWHEFPGGRKAVYNAKEAVRAMGQATPVVVQRQAPKRAHAAGNSQSTDAGTRVTALVRSLPFDPATATDAEVLAHLAPTSVVTWVNSVSGLTESAVVYCRRKDNAKDTSLPLRSLRMENGEAGRRIVTFPTEDSGLRSVALEKLVSVR